ncbi:unnamed protein product, partial [Vitis vinifera]
MLSGVLERLCHSISSLRYRDCRYHLLLQARMCFLPMHQSQHQKKSSRRESGKLCEFLLKQMHRVPPISFKDTAIQSSKALIIFQLYCDRVCLKK